MKRTVTKVLAVIGALAAIAALLYFFRDKIKALLDQCGCKQAACDFEDLEDSVESAEEKAEEVFDEVKETAEDAKQKAEAIIEEFKDYADVPVPEADKE